MAKKILCVEDETHIRMLLTQTLDNAFEDDIDDEVLEILEAENGEEGLQLIKEERPDLVFLDVMMPKMNGFEVCQKVKEDPELADTYIILLTAKGQEVDKSKGTSVGANEYMTKPFNPELIISKVEEELSIKRSE